MLSAFFRLFAFGKEGVRYQKMLFDQTVIKELLDRVLLRRLL